MTFKIDDKSAKQISLISLFMSINILCWETFASSLVLKGLFGGVSALLSWFLIEFAFKKIPSVPQLIISVTCFIIVIVFAAVINSFNNSQTHVREIRKNEILGLWTSPALDESDSDLKLLFFLQDSVLITIDEEQEFTLDYQIRTSYLSMRGRGSKLMFTWKIRKLSNDSLIVEDKNKVIRFKKTNK